MCQVPTTVDDLVRLGHATDRRRADGRRTELQNAADLIMVLEVKEEEGNFGVVGIIIS